MSCNIILGSGLVSLICRKVLGDDWKIIPVGPSRFYSKGVPPLGDDFIVYDKKVLEIIDDWGINNKVPLLYKRPYSISGELMYNNVFASHYFDKIGYEDNPQTKDYFKNDFTVFPFGNIQLWKYLLRQFIDEIQSFYPKHRDAKNIAKIIDNTIVLNNGDVIEYDQMISTVPYPSLCQMLGCRDDNKECFNDTYYYYIHDSSIDLEGSNQALVCDPEIPFHKCTKIHGNKYVFEFLEYIEDIYNTLTPILGAKFDIIDAKMVKDGHVTKGIINQNLMNTNKITCVGSYAQCDPLIDIGSVIKRVHNLVTNKRL